VAKCNIGKALSYQLYRYITMGFAGAHTDPDTTTLPESLGSRL
jgi:hypothetical protein